MKTKQDLLAEINEGLPQFDWKQGALDYVQHHFSTALPQQIEEFAFTKPLGAITPEDPDGSLAEAIYYLYNFTNTIQLLKLKRSSRVLDVACGAGWLSHWLTKLGYTAYGIDISSEFIALARRRMAADPHLGMAPAAIEDMFGVLDLEESALPDAFRGSFDAAILESCLHHFFNPVSALTHVAEGMKADGAVLILEGECRVGALKPAYVKVMRETHTLERPYTRSQLIKILEYSGLNHYKFLGAANGFFAEGDPASLRLTEEVSEHRAAANIVIAAKSVEGLERIIPVHSRPNFLRRLVNATERRIPSALRPAAKKIWHTIRPYPRNCGYK